MKNMFGLGNSQGLPTTTSGGGGMASSSSSSSTTPSPLASLAHHLRRDPHDGSARSIRVTPTIVKWWRRLSPAIQRTYMTAVVCLVLMWMGYRWIRHENAYVHLDCNSMECSVRVQPVGWVRPTSLNIARRQLVSSLPVKTQKDGTFVADENVKIDDYTAGRNQYKKGKKGKKYNKKKNTGNYKGPDDDGYYLSYEFIFKDKDIATVHRRVREQGEMAGEAPDADESEDEQNLPETVSLEPLMPFLQATNDDDEYRLVVRQFRSAQSRRRVRTMTQKVTSYIKRRRQKLVVKENAAPSWQGIVMLVLGLVGFLLSVLLGQVWEEESPKVTSLQERRRLKQQQQQRQQRHTREINQYARLSTGPRRTSQPSSSPSQRESSYGGYRPPANSQTANTTRRRY